MTPPARPKFDPIAVLQALDRQRVSYVVIGALARVIQGSVELTDGIDLVPSTRVENLRRLQLALEELNAAAQTGRRSRSKRTSPRSRCWSCRPRTAS